MLEQVIAKSEHDRLVEKLHVRLVASGFSDIRVELPGCVKPERIVWASTGLGHVPDASAHYLLKQHIFEVETAESIGDAHRYEQCKLFAAYSRGNSAEFTLVVPIGCGNDANRWLSCWRLQARVQEH